MPFVAAWMDLEIIILSDVNQTNTIAYHLYVESKKKMIKDFPGDPVVKTLPANAGHMGSVPDLEDSTCRTATKPVLHNS